MSDASHDISSSRPSHAAAPSKARYAAIMVGVCLGAVAMACGVASMLGGDSRTLLLAGAAIAVGCLPTFIPVLFGGRTRSGASNFGLCVLFASGARTLLILSIALAFDQTRELAHRPAFFIGVVAGAGLILLAESIAAIMLLSRMEQQKKVISA